VCGIAGQVDFERDLRYEVESAQAMTDTMRSRGPDAEGLWTDEHVALGHRRLSIIDFEGGQQPMTAEEDGRTLAVIVYSGEVYNFRELRRELVCSGHHLRTESDTEVVLRAYLEWGENFVDRLNGMYAFAIWDVRREQLLLVRDRLGVKPLYYYPTSAGLLFGSEPKAILAETKVRPLVSADGLRELLAFDKTPGHGIYKGMYEVCPGQLIRVRRNALSKHHYWQLEARDHTDDLSKTIRTIRELLEDIVTRQLIADVPLCTLLSGGVDSSAITALAAKALREQGAGPVRSFAVDFVGHPENFRSDALRETPDGPFVHELAECVGADHSDIVLSTTDLMDPVAWKAVLRATDLPMSLGETFTSLYLLFRAIRGQSIVALSGESADEIFGGYAWFHDGQAVNADTFPWLALMGRTMGNHSDLAISPLNLGLFARLDMPGYVADSYRTALAQVPRLTGETALQARMREVCYLHATRYMQILLDRKDRMSMANGLEVRVPYCDHRLVEYVFNIPWALKTFDGREKSLLRAATADVLPRSVVGRRKSPYPSTQDPAYLGALRGELAEMLIRKSLPVEPLLNRRGAKALLSIPVSAVRSSMLRRHIEIVLGFNAWLERYNVDIEWS